MAGTQARIGRVAVVDAHPIFRRGLVACLAALEAVEWVEGAGSVQEARAELRLHEADLLLVDHAIDGAPELIADVAGRGHARVIVCSDVQTPDLVRASIGAGAIGLMSKSTLKPDMLLAALLAAANGSGIVAAGLLGELAGSRMTNGSPPQAPAEPPPAAPRAPGAPSPLTVREQSVMALIAEGQPTREVARRLAYSERTVKNVLHDVVVKLGAHSRSHAVACAVRAGLI